MLRYPLPLGWGIYNQPSIKQNKDGVVIATKNKFIAKKDGVYVAGSTFWSDRNGGDAGTQLRYSFVLKGGHGEKESGGFRGFASTPWATSYAHAECLPTLLSPHREPEIHRVDPEPGSTPRLL